MFYTIYKTTNLINGKCYIGKHKTQNLDDNYLGSGKLLIHAIHKYGVDNFTKEYLFIFDNEEDMNNKEHELVTAEFIKEDTNYNLRIGGEGGWDYVNEKLMKDDDFRHNYIQTLKNTRANKSKDEILLHNKNISEALKEYHKFNDNAFKGRSHTDETKRKIGKSNSIKQKGSNNSIYGMMWIYSLDEKKSKLIKKDEKIPNGWHKGRKMKFS